MRLIKIFILSVLLTLGAYGKGRINGYCEQGGQKVVTASITSTTSVQKSNPGCTVTVYLTGTTTPATIFSDNSGTSKANPFIADVSSGAYFFYANDQVVDVKLSGTVSPAFTIGAVDIVDPYFVQIGANVARLISAKQQDYVSVKDYGALGDGSTNDLAAIQAAANGVCTLGTLQPELHFPAGQYNINGNIALPCAMTITGDGQFNTIIWETKQSSLTRAVTTDFSLTMMDIQVSTTPLVGVNLGMTGVARGFNPNATSVGQRFMFFNYRSIGFNIGLVISGKDNFTDLFDDFIVDGCFIQTYTAIAAVSQPLNGANGKRALVVNSTLIGDGNGDHGIYYIAIRDVKVVNNFFDHFASSAVKLLTASFGGGAVCPTEHHDYPGWYVSGNTISNSLQAFAAYTYCAVEIPVVDWSHNIVNNQPTTYTPDFAAVYIQASCQSIMHHVNSDGNTYYNLGLGGLVLLSSIQNPSDGCADPMASGIIEDFTSSNDSCTLFSNAMTATFPCINASGPNLGRATITNLHSNGGGGPLNLSGFLNVQLNNIFSQDGPVSNVYATTQIEPNETTRTAIRIKVPDSYTANIFEIVDSMGGLKANITSDYKINFDSTPGIFSTNGTRLQLGHVILGGFTLASGTVTVNLTGAAVYTSGTSYACTANISSSATPILVSNGTGSAFTIADGSGSSSLTGHFICIGN